MHKQEENPLKMCLQFVLAFTLCLSLFEYVPRVAIGFPNWTQWKPLVPEGLDWVQTEI